MGLLDFIEKNNGIRFSPHGFGQLSAFLITHISRRRPDQSGYGIFLHILTHIYPYHVVFIIKKSGRQCLGQLRLTYAGRPQKQERTDRLAGILDSGLGTDNSLRHLCHAFILAHNPLMELFVQMQGFVSFTLCQLGNGNSGPPGHDPGNFILTYALMDQGKILALNRLFLDLQLFAQFRQLAVA